MSGLWEFLNGKKTVIGTICLFLAAFITEVIIGQWESGDLIYPKIASTLNWIGMVIGGTGLAHKAVKPPTV